MTNDKTKILLLTFDYELFLGKRSGSVENCLITPTNHLLQLLSNYNIQSVFFIDTVYLMRMEHLASKYDSVKRDFEIIKKQLIDIVKQKHYLFHHIHPHWLDAQYLANINQWDLSNTEKLTFDKISEEEQNMVMSYSDKFLKSIYKDAGSEKTPSGYRAGGLFIEPFEKIKPFFIEYGIKYDFSVLPGDKRNDSVSKFDFVMTPSDRAYCFHDDISKESHNGQFVEYPISSLEIKNFTKVFNGIYYRLMKNSQKMNIFGDGVPISAKINESDINENKNNLFSMTIPASIDILNPTLLRLYKKYIKKSNYFHLLSHPKLLTPVSLKQLDKFLAYTCKRYELYLMSNPQPVTRNPQPVTLAPSGVEVRKPETKNKSFHNDII